MSIDSLPGILAETGATKVLLVVDASFPYLSIGDKVRQMPVPYVVFDHFGSNPLYEDVCLGVRLFNDECCDTIVAVGGGSTIDVAKCIKLYCRMDSAANYLQQETFDSGIPLIAVPTTAGTGSEATRFAVIYYEGKKQSVNHVSIIPNYAILEPTVLMTLPLYQKKCTVLDALCQGIESWWSINSTDESKVYSRQAVKLIFDNIESYIFDAADLRVADNIMRAANFAGKAINITQTTAPHAFSYKLTSLYGLPHGHAVAVCLPAIWNYMLDHPQKCIDTRGTEYLQGVFHDIAQTLDCSTPQEAVVYFRDLLQRMEMKYPVTTDRESDLAILTTSVNPVRLKNNPVALDTAAIGELYGGILLNS